MTAAGIFRRTIKCALGGGAMALVLAASGLRAEVAEQQVLAIINQARVAKGCAALVINPKLVAAARAQSSAMAQQNFFGHAGKDGRKFAYRAKTQGYRYRLIGENIAAGQKTAAEVSRDWLQSPSHRHNIMNCSYVETGIAMTYQANDAPLKGYAMPLNYYWVQVFGKE